jgi:hypothetical protein
MAHYDVAHFIKKFESVNDSDCCTKTICKGGSNSPLQFDCLGFCQDKDGKFLRKEQLMLFNILKNPISIWDGHHPEFTQETPKKRILAALYKLQEQQNIEQYISNK